MSTPLLSEHHQLSIWSLRFCTCSLQIRTLKKIICLIFCFFPMQLRTSNMGFLKKLHSKLVRLLFLSFGMMMLHARSSLLWGKANIWVVCDLGAWRSKQVSSWYCVQLHCGSNSLIPHHTNRVWYMGPCLHEERMSYCMLGVLKSWEKTSSQENHAVSSCSFSLWRFCDRCVKPASFSYLCILYLRNVPEIASMLDFFLLSWHFAAWTNCLLAIERGCVVPLSDWTCGHRGPVSRAYQAVSVLVMEVHSWQLVPLCVSEWLRSLSDSAWACCLSGFTPEAYLGKKDLTSYPKGT